MGFINKNKDNHFLHGFGIGLAVLPLAILGSVSWFGFVLHLIVITLSVGAISVWSGNADIEEYGRGGLVAATLILL